MGLRHNRFVVVSGGVFDVMKVELVLTGSCDGYSSICAGSLEASVTVAASVFFATERLDAKPEAASTREQKYSLRSAYDSSLPSPTTGEETIRVVSCYEMNSMTRSV